MNLTECHKQLFTLLFMNCVLFTVYEIAPNESNYKTLEAVSGLSLCFML